MVDEYNFDVGLKMSLSLKRALSWISLQRMNIRQRDSLLYFGSEFVSIGDTVKETISAFINMIDSHAALEA